MTKPTFTFAARVDDGDQSALDRDGFHIVAKIIRDDDGSNPWERAEGHGPVSDWRPLGSKRPGERVLSTDGRLARFYDHAEAVRMARRDGWGVHAEPQREGETLRAYRARAVEADFAFLKSWCDDEWYYVGVMVEVYRAGICLGYASCWGIEALAGAYVVEVAEGCAADAERDARAKLAELCEAGA